MILNSFLKIISFLKFRNEIWVTLRLYFIARNHCFHPQIWKTQPRTRILACTPSNSAADLIAERLLEHLPAGDILRFNAASRNYMNIPEKVKVWNLIFFRLEELHCDEIIDVSFLQISLFHQHLYICLWDGVYYRNVLSICLSSINNFTY
jgi:hypothetical protein